MGVRWWWKGYRGEGEEVGVVHEGSACRVGREDVMVVILEVGGGTNGYSSKL